MSEEVTYADLNFPLPGNAENIQKFDSLEIKAPSAPSQLWRRMTWALTLLCLLLLTGLGVLGSIFYRTSKTEMRKLRNLQNLYEELQRNISLEQKSNTSTSVTLQNIATMFCRELYKHQTEHKCKPCPEAWKWHEDTCYRLFDKTETWQNSEMQCSAWNASLLTIKSQSVLKYVKSLRLSGIWLGLSPGRNDDYYKPLDETIISSNWVVENTDHLDDKYCAYIYSPSLYYVRCATRNRFMCEKPADRVKIESLQ